MLASELEALAPSGAADAKRSAAACRPESPAGMLPLGILGGGDNLGAIPAGTRVWCDAFVIQRFPVTNATWLAFVNALIEAGDPEGAQAHVPRDNAADLNALGPAMFAFDGTRFTDPILPEGRGPRCPVLQVNWFSAEAFAAWTAARTGLPWRLPWEFEWEKAARGADARAACGQLALNPDGASSEAS